MKFITESVTKTSGRRGLLTTQRIPDSTYKTPLLLFIDHNLSREVLQIAGFKNFGVLLSYDGVEQMSSALKLYKKGISEFTGLKECPTFLTIKNTNEKTPSGHHEKGMLPIFRRAGRMNINAENYMNFVEVAKPDFYITLADGDTFETCSKKRVVKANERSEEMFNDCIKLQKGSSNNMIATVEGGYNEFERRKCAEYVKQFDDQISGYFIDGFHRNGCEATEMDLQKVTEIVKATLEHLPQEKLKVMLGAFSPIMTLSLINLEIDVFDSSFVNLVTKMNRALTFSFDLKRSVTDVQHVEPEIDLMDVNKYKDDFSPFLESCECLACKQHTKAYTSHLLVTKELLGPMLLTIHNLHHYSRFFEAIYESIKDNRLDDLKNLIHKQYENFTFSYDPPVTAKTNKKQ